MRSSPSFVLWGALCLAVSLSGCLIDRNATKNSNVKQYHMPQRENPKHSTEETKPSVSKSPKELDTIPDASEVKELNE